jgi:uncharacterized protein YecT (DUF1311 family)
MRLAALLLLLAAPAAAQEIDCANAMTQSDMNACAYQDWEAWDAELNAAYGAAMDLLQGWDANLPEGEKGNTEVMREAQRAWITFRDKACEAEAFAMKGGSAEPLIVYDCMARLTEARAGQLWDMVAASDF